MKCEDLEATIIDYLENTLDEGQCMKFEKHLETCERCLDELQDSQKVLQLISRDKMAIPDDSLRINFYHMLHGEIKKGERSGSVSRKIVSTPRNVNIYHIAAGFILLICGTFLGISIHSELVDSHTANELKQLQSEVTGLRKTAMFTMLKEESSSDRIEAVNYADNLEKPDANVIEVLVKTLNNDKNVNVRMAAAYALAKFADQRSVCDSLVRSLSLQEDPILQVTLINILVERAEKSAIKPIQQIISNKTTLKEVKEVAESGLRSLI